MWFDICSIALGVRLEMCDSVVEDSAWLRKVIDFNHVNVAELEVVLKGVNLAIKWGMKSPNLKADSSIVYGWLTMILTEERRSDQRVLEK